MFPTKNMFDYMTEINRLFPKNPENDILHSPLTPNTSLRSFNQSIGPSSSSTDTSPDSFPDLSPRCFAAEQFQHERQKHFDNQYERQKHSDNQYEYQYQYESRGKPSHNAPFIPPQKYETPFLVRRHRPIVGRKIMSATESQTTKVDDVSKVWLEESLSRTPPNTSMDQKYTQNTLYELFPPENKGNEFITPIKKPPSYTTSPNMSNTPPGFTNISPNMTNASYQRMSKLSPRMTDMSSRMTDMSPRMTEMSPNRKTSPGTSMSSYHQRFSTPTFKDPIVGPSTSLQPNLGQSKMCTFCRKNGETPLVYMTHMVKEKVGNKNVVTCPILRSHVCATCGASGDNAHTITYCPVLRSTNNGLPLQSTTITLKNTRVKSNGKRRY